MLNGSPGPMPGAPLKSPIVSLARPPPEIDPGPEARLMRLKVLYISARSCSFSRSLIGMFLITERSTSAKPGPTNWFRPTSPRKLVVPGQPVEPGTQYAAGLYHISPDLEKLRLTPASGLPI